MTKNIKRILKTSVLLFAGSFMLWNCESEADNLGSQFFDGTAATGSLQSFDIITYNVNNHDSIRADATKLATATLGAFTESQFGMQKSNFVTQARLATYNPDFGTNPVVDSVVLEIKPLYAVDSVKTVPYEDFTYENVAAKKVLSIYPISKYGKTKSSLKLTVHEVADFLGAPTDMVFSNKVVNYGAFLGDKVLNGNVTGVKITKDSDNSDLFVRDAKIRIPLNPSYFQNKIIAKAGQPELSDVSNFIRYFKGIRISAEQNDGYIFNFTPNDTQIQIYYKKDVTSNGTTTATPTVYTMSLGSGNARFNQIEFNRAGTPSEAIRAITLPNYQTGDEKLYAQGMGGPSFGVRIPQTTIDQIRTLYQTKKIGILSAKIRLYSDATWNNNYKKPATFTTNYYDPATQAKDLSTFLKDMSAFASLGVKDLVSSDLTKTPAYYDVIVTQTLKEIVEKSAQNRDIILEVGAFQESSTGTGLLGPSYNSRAYTPNRIVLVGSKDTSNQYRAQLNVTYSSK